MLKELARATPLGGDRGNQHMGGKPATVADPPSPYREALEKSNIPPRTATRYPQLADIPADDFDAAQADPSWKPTIAKLNREIRNPIPQEIKARALLTIIPTIRC